MKPNTQHHAQGQARRNKLGTGGVKAWLVVTETGESSVEEIGKQSIMRRTGLPARDLRALDPVLSYPSSILGREKAIVVNLEHIKAILTAKEVFVLNSSNPLVVQFVQDLCHRICFPTNYVTQDHHHVLVHNNMEREDAGEATWSPIFDGNHNVGTNSSHSVPVAANPKVLPFEFRALEACLESACRCLESETKTLENEAYPALDELTSKISTLNLERVRQIKSRLVAISGRVQKVRDELEHLLDDDNDMAEMYLTEKLTARYEDQSLSRDEETNLDLEVVDQSDGSKSESNSETGTLLKPNIEELEMLLEAYFAQIDGILQKLCHMSEYVGDTEDFINIMLDDKQNQLLRMGVMFSIANLILNAGIVVVGLFGMNIHISLFDGENIQFCETVIGTVGGCVALYAIAVGWGKNFLAL